MAKKPMLDAGVLNAEEMGFVGSAMLVVYAVGRFTNGVLADRSNVRRFISFGLLGSAIVNLLLGQFPMFWSFALLWSMNGWFQSIGSAPCVVSLSQWFSHGERGTRYGLWSIAHGLGEGMSFLMTSLVVSVLGWEWGFWGPGLVCVVVGLVLLRTLADRPETLGLPPVDVYRNDPPPVESRGDVGSMQAGVLRNGAVWMLGLASASMYVARYGINSWGSVYLQEGKGYSGVAAGALLSAHPILGLLGSAASGWVSDRFFGASRVVPCLIFGVVETAGLVALYLIPPGWQWADTVAMGVFGFATGGLLVYLGGLMATDIVPQRATGAAMGLVGFLSYLGAAVQDWASGALIQVTVDVGSLAAASASGLEPPAHGFEGAMMMWIGASVLSMLLVAFVGMRGRGRQRGNSNP